MVPQVRPDSPAVLSPLALAQRQSCSFSPAQMQPPKLKKWCRTLQTSTCYACISAVTICITCATRVPAQVALKENHLQRLLQDNIKIAIVLFPDCSQP